MNRILMLISLLALLALAACGGTASAPEAAVDEPAAAEPAATDGTGGEALPATSPPDATPTPLPPPVIAESSPTAAAAPPETDMGPAAALEGAWPADAFGYGIQIHGNATVGDPVQTMDVVSHQLGMNWVKVQIQWWLVKPAPDADQWFFYDGVVAEAHQQGLRLLVSVVGAPKWTRAMGGENGPPDDYGQYAAFLTELLNRYPGQVDAIEVWNEQNLDREWTAANGISAADYVNFLSTAHAAIKAVDPDIIVLSGALSPTGGWTEADGRVTAVDDFIYLDQMLAAGALDYADCVGVHHNGYNIGPDVAFDQASATAEAATASFRGPFDNPHHSWSFRTTLDTYAEKVQAVDPDMKLCVTEFGWASSEGYDALPEGFGFAQDNTLDEQATYIVQAFQQMRQSGDVWLAFLFNFDFGNKGSGPTDDPVPYSIIDVNGVPRPAFGALAGMEKTP